MQINWHEFWTKKAQIRLGIQTQPAWGSMQLLYHLCHHHCRQGSLFKSKYSQQAEALLVTHSQTDGTFLVRTNERNNVVISIVYDKKPFHVQVSVIEEGEEMLYE